MFQCMSGLNIPFKQILVEKKEYNFFFKLHIFLEEEV